MSSSPNVHNTPLWPPNRAKKRRGNDENEPPATPTPSRALHSEADLETLRLTDRNPLVNKRRYQNGFVAPSPKTPSNKPYTLASTGRTRQKPFISPTPFVLPSLKSIPSSEWNELARKHGLITSSQSLRDYQVEGANHIIARESDLCIVAPTGAGKSTLWTLPLLAQKGGISLVVVPFTSLGVQGENRHRDSAISATFLNSKNSSLSVLEGIVKMDEMHVVYACPEMLETPSVARILHSPSFQERLSGVYIDEAHVVYESLSWRPTYTRLHLLRQILGTSIPLIAMSATLPDRYRQALVLYAGLRADYHLINLGNFRPELSTIVKLMMHAATTFMDLEFVLALARQFTIIIYSDDLETLTRMFWWFYKKLVSARLPVSWLNVLHAGLSDEHQRLCIDTVCDGRVRILLGSDKIGAGMDFPSVGVVIQYQCRGLSLVRWEQRKGRGARRQGLTATGILLVEKSMAGDAKKLKSEDQGLLDLIHSKDDCLQSVQLLPELQSITHQYTFMPEHTRKSAPRGSLADTDAKKIYEDLRLWRTKEWEERWKEEWPGYGPECIISTADMHALANRAHAVITIDDIDSMTSIPHLSTLGTSLLSALHSSVRRVCGEDALEDSVPAPVVELEIPRNLRWQSPQDPGTIEAAEEQAEINRRVGRLAMGEGVLEF
ncbi:hypothetical protein D9611_002633 [Ephemerocybe angulata]|uniref:DNA 3'-5' helicase n=1 Tax=Ephemerocybe angulata TaxID=980116 RepID=A0A8H5FED7_9AGAR|nr:hypothetical protein D9611_002633 [Tulosesus angulatus]